MKKLIHSAIWGVIATVFTCIMVVFLFTYMGNTTLEHPKTYWPILALWFILSFMVWLSKTIIENSRNGH